MKRKVRRTLTNPLTVVLPIVIILLLAWNQYVLSSRNLSVSVQNILPNGSFDEFGTNNAPQAWTLSKQGSFAAKTASTKGYVSGKSLLLQITKYRSGSAELRSSKITLRPDTTYLYKGYYSTSAAFDLLVRYFYANGTSQLHYVQTYPNSAGAWSTDSVAFQTQNTIRAVQFVYRAASNSNLQLDDTYLEAKSSGVYIAPTTRDDNMLIPNGNLRQASGTKPTGWLTYRADKNDATFSYVQQPKQPPYVSVSLSNYQSGEAKWQYRPQAVSAGQAFSFGVSYQSTAPSSIVAEYVMQNGRHQFTTLATLMPAGEWTRRQASFAVPAGAKTLFVSVVLQHNGTLDTTGYALRDITKPGPRTFAGPLVSITFDDGWKSAIQNALPILNDFGYKGTFYLNASALNTSNFISNDQAAALAAAGEEVGSHAFAHVDLTAINAAEIQNQLQTGQSSLQKLLGANVPDFATPYGKSDAEVQYYARNYYRSLRSTDSGVNTRQNFDPYDLKVFYVSSNTTTAEVQAALNEAKAYHGWLIFVYHRVQTSTARATAAGEDVIVSPGHFKAQINAIHASNIPVKTLTAALANLQKQ